MLEYCDEPFLCRRKMQLQFLGEEFDSKDCNMMCDNCKKDLTVKEEDYTQIARDLIAFI